MPKKNIFDNFKLDWAEIIFPKLVGLLKIDILKSLEFL